MGQHTLITRHVSFTEVVSQNKHSETTPYGHLVITATFCGRLAKTAIHFIVKKTLVNTATPLTWPIFLWPIGDRINGAPILYSRSSPCLLVMDIVASYKHLAITSVWRNISAS